MNKIIQQFLGACIVIIPTITMAQDDLSVGVGVMARSGLYKDENTQFTAIPMIHWDSGRFFVKGTELGVHMLNKESAHALNASIYYSPFMFDPDESDSDQMKKLSKRKSTAMAAIEYKYKINQGNAGIVHVKLAGDILSESDTLLVETGYTYPIHVSEKLTITPNAGVTWYNKKHNDYYFGVSEQESVNTGFQRFEAKDSLEPHIAVAMRYKFNNHWSVLGTVKHSFTSSKVKDSPIVDQSSVTMGMAGIQYTF